MIKCPDCGKKFAKQPLYEIQNDGTKKWIWKNFIKMEIEWVLVLVAIFLIIFSFNAAFEQSKVALDDPCGYAKQAGCTPTHMMDQDNYIPGSDIETLSKIDYSKVNLE